jgi:hypothetical protein
MKMRKQTITIQLHGCVFNRKIVRRIAFQYWIAFMVTKTFGFGFPILISYLKEDFRSMLELSLSLILSIISF